jgi:hypothetical protein
MDLECIVVDACAIIKGQGLQLRKVGKSYVTTQETLAEIRDSKGREALNSLPFEIEIRQPKEQSLAIGNCYIYFMLLVNISFFFPFSLTYSLNNFQIS